MRLNEYVYLTDLHSCPKYQTDSVQLLSVLCVEWVLSINSEEESESHDMNLLYIFVDY